MSAGRDVHVVLIRHAPTRGNLEGRYIGTTDEGLGNQGRELAQKARGAYARLKPQALFTSGMRRCDETAAIVFPGLPAVHVAGLCEMRFGAFEGKTFAELSGDARYQAWVDAGCATACPQGEDQAGFVARVREAFEKTLDRCVAEQIGDAAFLVHAGTIMAAMSELARPRKAYWDWKAPYCSGSAARAHKAENGWQLVDVEPLATHASYIE